MEWTALVTTALENQPDTTEDWSTDGTKMKACVLSNTVLVEFVNSMNFLKKTADSSELLTIMHVFSLNFCQDFLQAETGISHQTQGGRIPSQNS